MTINKAALEYYMKRFRSLIEEKTGKKLRSFEENSYFKSQEGYKENIYRREKELRETANWTKADVGTGRIAAHMIRAVQKCENLVASHQIVHFQNVVKKKTTEAESVLYNIYCTEDASLSFGDAVRLFGAKYDLISYLFFLKDSTRFLPIRPTFFDKIFSMLGIDFSTAYKCSWENYLTFTQIVSQVRSFMEEYYAFYVSLLDAHSFLWQLSVIDFSEEIPAEKLEFDKDKFGAKDRVGEVKLRIGQGEYRKQLKRIWKDACSVTGCAKTDVLIASHIKPWRDCEKENEWRNPYNGLLLTPNLDKLFDEGYISFDKRGEIIISTLLSEDDLKKLGVSRSMKLRFLFEELEIFMEYHRKEIFHN